MVDRSAAARKAWETIRARGSASSKAKRAWETRRNKTGQKPRPKKEHKHSHVFNWIKKGEGKLEKGAIWKQGYAFNPKTNEFITRNCGCGISWAELKKRLK